MSNLRFVKILKQFDCLRSKNYSIVSTVKVVRLENLPQHRNYHKTLLTSKSCLCYFDVKSNLLLKPSPPLWKELRGYKGKKDQAESSSDSESESDIEDVNVGNESEAPDNFEVKTLHVPSLRADSIVSNGLGYTRNRVYDMTLSNQVKLNGAKLVKKGKKMEVGDYADVVVETTEDVDRVQRIKLVKVESEKSKKDKFVVHAIVWKTPFDIGNS